MDAFFANDDPMPFVAVSSMAGEETWRKLERWIGVMTVTMEDSRPEDEDDNNDNDYCVSPI